MRISENMTDVVRSSSSAISFNKEEKQTGKLGGGVVSEVVSDKIDVQNSFLSDPENHVKVLDAGSGQKACLVFSEATSKVAAFLVDRDGKMFTIKQENIPSDLSKIDTVEKFEGFLGSVHARGAVLSDGEPKLYIEQRGLGGMWKGNFNPNLPAGTYGPPMPPSHNFGVHGGAVAAIGPKVNYGALSAGVHGCVEGPGGSVCGNVTHIVQTSGKPDTSFSANFRLKF